jgi:hypothetical protein
MRRSFVGTTTTFQFKSGIYTALLTTTDRSLTGNLSTKRLTDSITVSGDAASFMTQHNGGVTPIVMSHKKRAHGDRTGALQPFQCGPSSQKVTCE